MEIMLNADVFELKYTDSAAFILAQMDIAMLLLYYSAIL